MGFLMRGICLMVAALLQLVMPATAALSFRSVPCHEKPRDLFWRTWFAGCQ